MKTKFIWSAVLIGLVILQSTLLDFLKIFNVKPDLVLIAIIIISLSLELKWVMIFSYLAGFLKDVLSGLPIGLNTIVLSFFGFLVFRLSRKVVIENKYMIGALIFMAAIFENLVVLLLFIPFGLKVPIGISFRFIIIGSVYTVLVYLLVSKIIRLSKITSHF